MSTSWLDENWELLWKIESFGFKIRPSSSWTPGTYFTGAVKQQSEEAGHASCFDCGYSSGKHSRFCTKGAK